MTTGMDMAGSRLWRRLRVWVWGLAAGLLVLPMVAMRFSREVQWTGTDFALMGLMLAFLCGAYEVALRVARSHAYVLASGMAGAAGLLLSWANLAVGIIGSEDRTVNLIFFAVPAIALVGAGLARLRPLEMARAMEAAALAQVATSLVALAIEGVYVFMLTGVFVVLWMVAAQLFRQAARQEAALPGDARGCGTTDQRGAVSAE